MNLYEIDYYDKYSSEKKQPLHQVTYHMRL